MLVPRTLRAWAVAIAAAVVALGVSAGIAPTGARPSEAAGARAPGVRGPAVRVVSPVPVLVPSFQPACRGGEQRDCVCREALCERAAYAHTSYFTGDACSGIEYTVGGHSWDGAGLVGAAVATVTIRSRREADGACRATTHALRYNPTCTAYFARAFAIAARRVYRGSSAPAPPIRHVATSPGAVLSSESHSGWQCPGG